MTLSSWDDYPVHQAPEFIAHPATSDRNFYDRYYFNLHGCTGELFAVIGVGQYPNLSTADAFISVLAGDEHRVVRSSRVLGGDRMDTTVGPIRVEVVEERRRPLDEPVHWADVSKVRALGWTPQFSITDTLKEILDHWRRKPATAT